MLRFDNRSITAVGVILGVVFLGAAANEAMIAALSLGWRWLHWLLAGIFLLGALWAFIRPEDPYWALASVLGFVLVIKGTADIAEAAATSDVNDLWWVGLVAGILEIVLAFWVSAVLSSARRPADSLGRVRGAVPGRHRDCARVSAAQGLSRWVGAS